jgi:hypothetical protein
MIFHCESEHDLELVSKYIFTLAETLSETDTPMDIKVIVDTPVLKTSLISIICNTEQELGTKSPKSSTKLTLKITVKNKPE